MNATLAVDIALWAHDGIHLPTCSRISTEPHTIFAGMIAALKNGHLDLPVLPDMARKVQNLIDDPDAPVSKIVDLLSSDPVVSMHVIKAANSAALSNGRPVNDLRSAVSRLGNRMLRCLVISVTMAPLFQANSPLINRQLIKLWKHSREVAARSYLLAQRQRHLKPEVAMLAGLVHDIGALPLYLYADRGHSHFDQSALEQLVDEFSALAGTRLLQSWNFPEELVAVVAEHEDLYRVNDSGIADYVDVVTVANLQIPGAACFIAWKNIFAAERLDYYAADCRNFLSNHAEQLAATRDMLGIDTARH